NLDDCESFPCQGTHGRHSKAVRFLKRTLQQQSQNRQPWDRRLRQAAGFLWQEDWADAVVQAVDGEITAVDGEDFASVLTLGGAQQGSVGKVHFAVDVLAHQFADPGDIVR